MEPIAKTSPDRERTIVQKSLAYSEFPFQAISPEVLSKLQQCQAYVSNASLAKILECFLQITSQEIRPETLASQTLAKIFRGFIGALCCNTFVRYTTSRCLVVSHHAHGLFKALAGDGRTEGLPGFKVSTTGLTQFQIECRNEFAALSLNKEAIWLWRAWPSRNKRNRETQLPLYSVYIRLGRPFTTELHNVCNDYYRGRKCQRIIAIDDLAKFIGDHKEISLKKIKSSAFMDKFWREFFIYHLTKGHASGLDIAYLLRNWNNEFAFFAKEYLIGSGLFSGPIGEFPRSSEGSYQHPKHSHITIIDGGKKIKTKLITHIPLEVTDQEAIEILFYKIKEDIQIILDWARSSASNIWSRYNRRKHAIGHGEVRIMGKKNAPSRQRNLANNDNPKYLENISAAFEHYGYLTSNEIHLQSLFGKDLVLAATELALPTTGSLLAHCVILVALHPIITASFLENLELYDNNGNMTGYAHVNGVPVLIGRKDRNGPAKALQTISLTEESDAIVTQIIALTAPLRKYLKSKSDSNWRKLLLVSGRSFAYPKPLSRLASDTSIQDRCNRVALEISHESKISMEAARDYMSRFSLPALRAQAGVLVYLETKDCAKMATALGHTEYKPNLLSRYLPETILSFFQERWIRIFQTGIIVTAMKDSHNTLAASGFESFSQLDSFLENHALKLLPSNDSQENNAPINRTNSEILFNINSEIINIFLSLQDAFSARADPPPGKAYYWAKIGDHLIKYLESSECKRDDLKNYLASARSMPIVKFAEGVFHD